MMMNAVCYIWQGSQFTVKDPYKHLPVKRWPIAGAIFQHQPIILSFIYRLFICDSLQCPFVTANNVCSLLNQELVELVIS